MGGLGFGGLGPLHFGPVGLVRRKVGVKMADGLRLGSKEAT